MKGAQRDAVVKNARCYRCGTSDKLEVHHIIPRRIGGADDHFNLIPLCKGCHKFIEVMTCDLITRSIAPEAIRSRIIGELPYQRLKESNENRNAPTVGDHPISQEPAQDLAARD
jgi:hypothetical protein